MKWTRQRCHEACSTLATAALMPSWASEMASLTPRRPRRASFRFAGSDISQKLLQGRAVEGGARESAIVVVVGDEPPALMGLALDVGLAGLALGVERVEFEVEIMLGRLAGVDRAAKDLSFGWLHRCTFLGSGETLPPRRRERPASAMSAWAPARSPLMSSRRLMPKKRGPLQAVPVM